MIRINLLPVKAAQKKEKLKGQLVTAAASVVVTVALCALAYMQLLGWVDAAAVDVDNKKLEVSRLMKTIGEVNQFKKRQEDLRAKLDILDKLEKSRSGPVHLLDELYKSLPEKIWLESFKEAGGKASIAGMAVNEETVAVFMHNMETSGNFSGVTLKMIQQVDKDGVKFHKFELDCNLTAQQNVDVGAAGGKDGKPKKAVQGT